MNIRTYIFKLAKQMREGNAPADARVKLSYARAYMQGEAGLTRYRDRAIAAEIAKVHDRDAQLAILFNKDIHPEEYEAYQAFRAECKNTVDASIKMLKAELESIINEGSV